MMRHDGPRRPIPPEDIAVIQAFIRDKCDADARAQLVELELEPWRRACPHTSICDAEAECDRRGLTCDCTEPHNTEAACVAYQREWPADPDKDRDE